MRDESAHLADERFRNLGGPRLHDSYGDVPVVALRREPSSTGSFSQPCLARPPTPEIGDEEDATGLPPRPRFQAGAVLPTLANLGHRSSLPQRPRWRPR